MSDPSERRRLAGPPAINMNGRQIAHWTVLRQTWSRRSRAQWLCQCSCGAEVTISGNQLRGMARKGALGCAKCGLGWRKTQPSP